NVWRGPLTVTPEAALTTYGVMPRGLVRATVVAQLVTPAVATRRIVTLPAATSTQTVRRLAMASFWAKRTEARASWKNAGPSNGVVLSRENAHPARIHTTMMTTTSSTRVKPCARRIMIAIGWMTAPGETVEQAFRAAEGLPFTEAQRTGSACADV